MNTQQVSDDISHDIFHGFLMIFKAVPIILTTFFSMVFPMCLKPRLIGKTHPELSVDYYDGHTAARGEWPWYNSLSLVQGIYPVNVAMVCYDVMCIYIYNDIYIYMYI